jgi:aromatic-L-amino-acid decarboxylase
MNAAEFRKIGHELIDWVADYREHLEGLPVRSRVQPGEVRSRLAGAPPAKPEPFSAIFHDLETIIVPGLSHWQHPSFYGYFPANSELSSVLGDYLSTGLGVLGLSWQSSPALTEVEELATDWMRQMVGLSTEWHGVIQDTASSSTLVALICARERASDFALMRGGLQGLSRPLVIYVSPQSHSSVEKAALLAGFGRQNIRVIETNAEFAMKAESLARAIAEDRQAGRVPCAVVATIGTTATTAIDPLKSIAEVAKSESVWVHVDAAMAGSAMILPECRWMWKGIEQADSLVINAHKWLGAAFDCSLYYVRDPQHLLRVMSTNPSYLQSAADSRVRNLRDWGIPLGRRFRALKLWLLIREQGVEGLQKRLRRDIENASWLAAKANERPRWRVLAPVVLQTVCLRHEPADLEGESLDKHTQDWCERVNASGGAYLTPAMLDGHWMVRVSVAGLSTERRHVAALWELMRREAEGQ